MWSSWALRTTLHSVVTVLVVCVFFVGVPFGRCIDRNDSLTDRELERRTVRKDGTRTDRWTERTSDLLANKQAGWQAGRLIERRTSRSARVRCIHVDDFDSDRN